MKVNDSNLTPPGITTGSTTSHRTEQTGRTGNAQRTAGDFAAGSSSDDVHLSELVRSLRQLAADSPERQARIEQLARSYADGSYRPDLEGTASAIIDDAFRK